MRDGKITMQKYTMQENWKNRMYIRFYCLFYIPSMGFEMLIPHNVSRVFLPTVRPKEALQAAEAASLLKYV